MGNLQIQSRTPKNTNDRVTATPVGGQGKFPRTSNDVPMSEKVPAGKPTYAEILTKGKRVKKLIINTLF